MKKVRLLLVFSLLFAVILTACGGQEVTAPEEDVVKVALVLDGKIDDMGWNQAGYEGLAKDIQGLINELKNTTEES